MSFKNEKQKKWHTSSFSQNNVEKPISEIGSDAEVRALAIALANKIIPIFTDSLLLKLNPLTEDIVAQLKFALNPLSELEALEKAYEKQWTLSTSQLSRLLHLNPELIVSYQTFERHGFIFNNVGKVDLEIGWKVTKISDIAYDDDY